MKKIFHSLTLATFIVFSMLTACSDEETVNPVLTGPQPTPTPTPSPTPPNSPPNTPPGNPPGNYVAPIAQAGNDTTIYVPFSSYTLNGGASKGSSLSYQWLLINGPAVFGVINYGTQNRPKTYVDRLVQVGVYEFELTVRDAYNLSSKDTVKVTVAEPACTSAMKELILKDQKWISPWYTQISLSNVFSYLPPNSFIKNFYIKRDDSDKWELVVPWNIDTSPGSGKHTWEHVHYFESNTWVLEIYPPDFEAMDTPDVKIEYCN